jgi:hypothetical protein
MPTLEPNARISPEFSAAHRKLDRRSSQVLRPSYTVTSLRAMAMALAAAAAAALGVTGKRSP